MHASDSLFRILCVHFVFRFAILFRNGKDAQALDGFERVSGFWMEHANANVHIVNAIEKHKNQYDADQDSFCENG